MTLADLINEYVEYKRSLGMLFRSPAVRLRAFLGEVGDVNLDLITPQQVRRHLDGKRGPVTSFWFAKY